MESRGPEVWRSCFRIFLISQNISFHPSMIDFFHSHTSQNFGSAPLWLNEMVAGKRSAIVSSALRILNSTNSTSAEYKQIIAIDFGISRARVDELLSWLSAQSATACENISKVGARVQVLIVLTAAMSMLVSLRLRVWCSDSCGICSPRAKTHDCTRRRVDEQQWD